MSRLNYFLISVAFTSSKIKMLGFCYKLNIEFSFRITKKISLGVLIHAHYGENYGPIRALMVQLLKLLRKWWEWTNPENYVKFHT